MDKSKEIILQNIKNSLNNTESNMDIDNTEYVHDKLGSDNDNAIECVREFTQNLEFLKGVVDIISDENDILKFIESIFKSTNSKSFIGWNTDYLSKIYEKLEEKGYQHIKSTGIKTQSTSDIGITAADYAISETGTIVLYNNKIQYRNASLIAPIHIAILRKENIVKNIFKLFSNIYNDYKKLSTIYELTNCVTLITGPSRTADIELNLTLGVHGPKELYVLVI